MRRRQTQLRALQRTQTQQQPTDANGLPLLTQPGYVRLFASYTPSLEAGTYSIDIQQTVAVPGQQTNTIRNSAAPTPASASPSIPQSFTVWAPRFSLDASDVHSTYPPDGHADSPHVLPHIVLNDPHLPWERFINDGPQDGINVVPWLAVLVFDPDELKVDATILQTTTTDPPIKQAKTMEVSMTLRQLLSRPNVAVPLDANEAGLDKSITTNAIFIKPDLFAALHDPPVSPDPLLSLDRYKYLAHVRNVNGSGGSIASLGDENGLYSVVVSSRTGPLTNTVPKNVVVHLVSLDGVRENVKVSSSTAYVGLISLYSWQYQCLPPTIDLPDQLRDLGTKGLGMLRPLNWDQPGLDPALAARLANGYSLVRHRVSTGESTVAFMRGPLSPVPIPYPLLASRAGGKIDLGAWPAEAFNSDGYQILDAELGIMDISYATAWQLGRAMAMADRTFAAALVNLRGEAYTTALAAAKAEYLRTQSSYRNRADVLASFSPLVAALSDVKNLDFLATNPQKRWAATSSKHADMSPRAPDIKALYSKHLANIMGQRPAEAATDANTDSFDIRSSANWPIVLNWLLDRLKLVNIPAYYLINHPSNVPTESIRFFHIDQNWIAAQIDGALSIGNQTSRPDDNALSTDAFVDEVRQGIKVCFAQYLATTDPAAIYPNGGFFTRSIVVKTFPDLIISSGNPNTQIVSTSGLAEDTLLTLMRRSGSTPNSNAAIIISQPPHQQRFVLGTGLDQDTLEISYTEVFTIDGQAPAGPWPVTGEDDHYHRVPQVGDAPLPVYDWSSRLINIPNLAQNTHNALIKAMGTNGGYKLPTTSSSAVLALQLNDPIYKMLFEEPTNPGEWAYVQYGSSFQQTPAAAASKIPSGPATGVAGGMTPTADPRSSTSETSAFILKPGDLFLKVSSIPPPHGGPALRLPTESVTITTPMPSRLTSQISLKIFANVNPPPASSTLPNNQDHYLDIIFSLQPQATTTGLQIESLVIRLPIASSPSPSSPTPLFTQKYDGPGAVMLGNNRFSPVLSSVTDAKSGQSYLVVTVTPRTLEGVVPFASSSNFSFLLREVAVDITTTGNVPVTLIETYSSAAGSSSGDSVVQTTVNVPKAPM